MKKIDDDVRRFLDELPSHLTFLERAEKCRERFGDRAPDIHAIKRDHHRRGGGRKWHPSRIDKNGPLRVFIEDRIGLRTLDQMVAEVAATFGPGATSRSAIARHWGKVRARVRRAGKPGRPAKAV